MNLEQFLKLLRSRWVTVLLTGLIVVAGTISFTILQTPLYKATTGLFVSTNSGTSVGDLYQGSRYSQERVVSYTELLTGETLARRTIDRLNLDMTADDLRERVTATSKQNTVLISVSVLDESPVRARDIANAMSDEFVLMARDLETFTEGDRPEARVIVEQRASIPDEPVIPRWGLNMSLGFFLGGMLGVGFAVLRDQLDNTVKDRETLENITGKGVVGTIPFDKSRRDHPTIAFDTDNSSTAEAFRKLRTNLQFLSVDDPARVIAVTSSVPSEGKSTTAINIALALAEAEHEVVLIDGDLRKPSIADYLGTVGSVGFSTVLSAAASLDESLQKTRFPRLTVLAAGATPPNPSELLGSQAAKKILNELRGQFDYVVIDTPPLLAVTDGAILATKADGTLVIVRAGETRREQLEHAIGTLEDVGATILGSILSMAPASRGGSYDYNYRYYGRSDNAKNQRG